MSETASAATSSPQADSIATSDRSPSGGNLVAQYRLDHSNPVNHFLHVAVGWPMVAISILILPFRPLWSAASFCRPIRSCFSATSCSSGTPRPFSKNRALPLSSPARLSAIFGAGCYDW